MRGQPLTLRRWVATYRAAFWSAAEHWKTPDAVRTLDYWNDAVRSWNGR